MALNFAPPTIQHEKGAISMGAYVVNGLAYVLAAEAAPTDGTSGDGAGYAGPGSLYIDATNAFLYINTGTKASPTWTKVGTQS